MMKASGLERNSPGRRTPRPERPAPWRYEGGEVTLSLRVQPGAGKTEPAGRYGDSALRLRLAAPALEGRANKACARFLAKALGVPLGSVRIIHGEASRDKVVRVQAVAEEKFQSLLARWKS